MAGSLVPLMLLAPVLVAVAASDLRHMRIPNVLSLAAVAQWSADGPAWVVAMP